MNVSSIATYAPLCLPMLILRACFSLDYGPVGYRVWVLIAAVTSFLCRAVCGKDHRLLSVQFRDTPIVSPLLLFDLS